MHPYAIIENKFKQKLLTPKDDFIARHIVRYGIYDQIGIFFIEKILSQLQDPITFDIGANIGNHALVMSKYSKMVYLFEPQSDIQQLLQETMKLNEINNWKIFSGLSDINETVTFYKNLDGNNGASTFSSELKREGCIEEKFTLQQGDQIVKDNEIEKVDFIKLDVEGYESKVLHGLIHTIHRFKPIIMIEWNNEITRKQFVKYDLFNTLFFDYTIKAVMYNTDKSYFHNKLFRKIRRKWNKLFNKKIVMTKFIPTLDYEHVFFIPNSKISLFNKV